MHELALCNGIRTVIETRARDHAVSRVTRVRLEVGRFACVEKAALAFAFDAAMRGSLAEGAELVLIDLPGRARCLDCGAEEELADRLDPCPACGGLRLVPVAGEELRIRDMEAI